MSAEQIQHTEPNGRTLFHVLAMCDVLNDEPLRQLELARHLIVCGVEHCSYMRGDDINTKPLNALHLALQHRKPSLVLFLLDCDGDIPASLWLPKDERGFSPSRLTFNWLCVRRDHLNLGGPAWRPIGAYILRIYEKASNFDSPVITFKKHHRDLYNEMRRDGRAARATCRLLAGILARRKTCFSKDMAGAIVRTCYDMRYDDCWAWKRGWNSLPKEERVVDEYPMELIEMRSDE